MKSPFADLRLCADASHACSASHLIRKAAELGYGLIGVPVSKGTLADIQQIEEICSRIGIGLAARLDLKPQSVEQLNDDLRKYRRRFHLIAVTCESRNVARQAAKDRRVDLLSFHGSDFKKRFFDAAQAELMSNCIAALEIDMHAILTTEGKTRINLLSNLRKEIGIAEDFHVPVILSSGASDLWGLRSPRELVALASLFGLSEAKALDAVGSEPISIVERNLRKLDSDFVAPGIRVVRWGRDC